MSLIPTSTGSYGSSEKETNDQRSGVDTHGSFESPSAVGSNAMTWTSQEDELVDALESCRSAFWSGLRQIQDIDLEDFVFCELSKDDDPLIPPPLQVLASTNLPFLQYQDSVVAFYTETQKLDCGRFERCGRIKESLLDELRNEWSKLEELKGRAWRMASLRTPDPSSVQIINTCEYMAWS